MQVHLWSMIRYKKPSKMAEDQCINPIDDAAALWAVRADMGLCASDEVELTAWMGSDVRHLGAYTRACAMLAQAGRVKALGPSFDPAAYQLQHAEKTGDGPQEHVVAMPTRRHFLVGGAAAAAATTLVTVGLSWPAAATTYSTQRGEIRRIPFPDGSSMTLNTETTAKVHFTREARHVELVEGEARFDVVRDKTRLFVVEAGPSRINALATSFTIRRLIDDDLRVTVGLGSVQLVSPGVPRPTILTKNMQALVRPAANKITLEPIAAFEISRDQAWQQGMLAFGDTTLREAAEQFSRYSATAIRFDDPTIGAETITGLYAANDPQGFARSVALSLGLNAAEQPGSILLSRSKNKISATAAD